MTNILTCKECGKFIAKTRNVTFCSNLCKFNWIKSHREIFKGRKSLLRKSRNCIICGKEFYFYPSQERVNHPCIYCSKQCWQEIRKTQIKGKDSPLWKDNKKPKYFRRWIKRFLPKACMNCGWDKEICDSCHRNPRSNGGKDTPENILILCPNCHRLFDRGKLDLKHIPILSIPQM